MSIGLSERQVRQLQCANACVEQQQSVLMCVRSSCG